MCSSILWADVEIYFNILLSISTAYYITTITNFINCILSNLVHLLMYWPDTSNNSLKPVENILSQSFQFSLDLFKYEVRSFWIFFFMLNAFHTLRAFEISKEPCCLLSTYVIWSLFYLSLVTSCLCGWLSQGICLAIYCLYLADFSAVYVIQPHDGPQLIQCNELDLGYWGCPWLRFYERKKL